MLIVYSCNDEVLVCTPETEADLLRVWFVEGGRDLEDYDREVRSDGVINIGARIKVMF